MLTHLLYLYLFKMLNYNVLLHCFCGYFEVNDCMELKLDSVLICCLWREALCVAAIYCYDNAVWCSSVLVLWLCIVSLVWLMLPINDS
jgi:hypothetical protein